MALQRDSESIWHCRWQAFPRLSISTMLVSSQAIWSKKHAANSASDLAFGQWKAPNTDVTSNDCSAHSRHGSKASPEQRVPMFTNAALSSPNWLLQWRWKKWSVRSGFWSRSIITPLTQRSAGKPLSEPIRVTFSTTRVRSGNSLNSSPMTSTFGSTGGRLHIALSAGPAYDTTNSTISQTNSGHCSDAKMIGANENSRSELTR